MEDWEEVGCDPARAQPNDVVQVCVLLLKESMLWLRRDLAAYESKVQAHRQKWFSSWRSIQTAGEVEKIEKHKHLFDMRLRMLLDIVAATKRVQ